jgi:hypothetical protein
MTRSIIALAALLAVYPGFAEPPSMSQILNAAREAAAQSQSQQIWLELAQMAEKHEPETALSDYRAAADAPPTAGRDARIVWSHERRIVEALLRLGDQERARTILRGTLTTTLADPPPQYGSDDWYSARMKIISEASGMLYPDDETLLRAALEKSAEWLEQIKSDSYRIKALDSHLALMALFEPEAAFNRATQSDGMPPGALFALHLLRSDPELFVEHLDELTDRARVRSDGGLDGDTLKVHLVAVMLLRDPERAMDLAVRLDLAHLPHRLPTPTLQPLVEAVSAVGVGALPMAPEYDVVYRRLCSDLAPVDGPGALELARSLVDPELAALALASVTWSLAESSPETATAAAQEIVALFDRVGKLEPNALESAAHALSKLNPDVMPELFARMNPYWIASSFGGWWRWHPDAADAALATYTGVRRNYALTGAVDTNHESLGVERSRAMLEEVIVTGRHLSDIYLARSLMLAAAEFDPGLGRQVWEGLPEVSDFASKNVRDRLDGILAVGLALERREPGAGGAEAAEIERILSAAPVDAPWIPAYRGGAALIYASSDPIRAAEVAEQALTEAGSSSSSYARSARSRAIEALARVDLERARQFLRERKELRDDDMAMRTILANVALRDPRTGWEMLHELYEEHEQGFSAQEVLTWVAAEGDPDSAREFINCWLEATEHPAEAMRWVVSGVLHSGRVEVIEALPDHFDQVPDNAELARVLGSYCVTLIVHAPDALLVDLQERFSELPPEVPATVTMAIAAATWERRPDEGRSLLEALSPEDRARALLLILRAREGERWQEADARHRQSRTWQ